MGACQCLMNNIQDTQSNVLVPHQESNDQAANPITKEDKTSSVKDIPKIVTDFVQLPTKKIKDDNDISEFIKPTQFSPLTKKSDKISIGVHGASEVGKTSFLMRFCQNKFDLCYIPSFPNESMRKVYAFNSAKYNLLFSVNNILEEGNDFDLIMFDLTIASTFNNALNLLEMNKDKYKRVFLIGNKSDLRPKKVDTQMINSVVMEHHCEYLETSIKENKGVAAVINRLITIYVELNK